METPEPSHFGPVLQFMEIPYKEARAEYLEILDSHIGEMLKDSKGFKDLLNLELALGRFAFGQMGWNQRFSSFGFSGSRRFS